ncbi:hypothetical protein DE146DRAFT_681986 [Phaeosphaeria sp. MPI-PUGE-AT-0046c]|nr:hypothetical protein DE146DRAFT_681986 [Phaeosphaeria sp. MPI-PUGE-AT-0046c]
MDTTKRPSAPPSRARTPQAGGESVLALTLYPKITTHVPEIIHALEELNRDSSNAERELNLDPIPFIGTVKLHGTHADILIYNDDRIVFQSRNIVGLQVAKDNAGFATTMSQKTKVLLRLRDLFIARFTQLHPHTSLDQSRPVLIAGEWIGQSIQKDVAISQLSKRFVIISVNINGQWQRDSDYGGIALPNHDIYNISRAGNFNRTLHFDNPQRTINELEILTEQVARQCPFAATFGIDGEGEGIVWKPALAPYNCNPNLWFKTKGGRFKPTFTRPPRQSPERAQQSREVAARVAEIWVSEQRLEQGLEYMREHGIQPTKKGMGPFLKWVQNDIAVEEKGYIAEHGVDAPTLRIEVAKIAKPWYTARLEA